MIGRIIKKESNEYIVINDSRKYKVPARGKINYKNGQVLVGDLVKIDEDNNIIDEILPRKNFLRRPKIANVDYGIIVMSLKNPDYSSNLLDKNISFLTFNKIDPIICFTKVDLLNKDELKSFEEIKNYYESIGIKTFFNTELDSLKKLIKDKVLFLTGQTGAGKSTLLNKIDHNLNLKTSPISKALNRGVHTTKHVEIYQINDFLIADTPGFSSLDLREFNKEDIKDSFIEFKNSNCEYRDCFHIHELNCVIKNKVKAGKILKSRYDNYQKFINEVKE